MKGMISDSSGFQDAAVSDPTGEKRHGLNSNQEFSIVPN